VSHAARWRYSLREIFTRKRDTGLMHNALQHTFVMYPGSDVLAFCLLSDSGTGKLWICDNPLRAKNTQKYQILHRHS
jgi:hypothetical protein